jgi:putative transcriptional regulator
MGVTRANLSLGQSGKTKGMRFDSLEKICRALDCQSGDMLELYEAPTYLVK